MSEAGDIEKLAFRFSGSSDGDLDRPSAMKAAVARAFPLPETGTFTDLLAAIDERCAGSPDRSAP